MSPEFASDDEEDWVDKERDVASVIGDSLDVDFEAHAIIGNLFRVANAVRNEMERTVLDEDDLSFTAFTVLWVLWIWGEQEARHVAEESAISRATLTGVLTTLERRGLARRRPNPNDRRSVLVSLTADGETTTRRLFTEFNARESEMSAPLSADERRTTAHALRTLLRHLEDGG